MIVPDVPDLDYVLPQIQALAVLGVATKQLCSGLVSRLHVHVVVLPVCVLCLSVELYVGNESYTNELCIVTGVGSLH